jgi:hypothetical protein
LGFLTVLAAVALWLASRGILSAAVKNAFLFPMQMQYEYGMTFADKVEKFRDKGLFYMPFLMAMGFGSLAVLRGFRDPRKIFPLLYILPVLFFYLWTGDLYQHYFIQLLPGLVLGAGLIIAGSFHESGKKRGKIVLILCLALFAWNNSTRIWQGYIHAAEIRSKIFPTEHWLSKEDQRLGYQKAVGKYIGLTLAEGQTLVTTTPTYAYLVGVPNSYRFFYIAPLTKAASGNDFADLPEAVDRARYFVLELRRAPYLPDGLAKEIQSTWRNVYLVSSDEQHLQVWENPKFIQ